MARFLIVPGYGDSGPDHWQSHWQRAWGDSACRIRPASWTAPNLTDWVYAIERAHAALSADGADVVIVAHSLGCLAAAHWLRSQAWPGLSALFVAVPDPNGREFPAAAKSFAAVAMEPLGAPVVVVASENDPHCAPAVSQTFADDWGAMWTTMGPRGHLNADSGLGRWPEGRAWAEALGRCDHPARDAMRSYAAIA